MSDPAVQHEPVRAGQIICVGEALIDLIAPPVSSWTEIAQFIPRIGGAPANMAVAIRRLGGRSAFLGCLADDQPGELIRQRLADEGVDLSLASTVRRAQTRLAIVTGSVDQRNFVFYGSPAADTLLAPAHVARTRLQRAGAIVAGSLSLLGEPSRSTMHQILHACVENDIPLVFDPNPRPTIWPSPQVAQSALLPFIRQASVLKLGSSEPPILGMSIDEIRSQQPDHAAMVLTDGPNGCWYWYGEDRSIPVPPVSVNAIDSTGAGDAFTAALALRFVEKDRRITEDDVRFASIVGALATTSEGAMDALPDQAAVERFLNAETDESIETAGE